jgi:hypothetical protein
LIKILASMAGEFDRVVLYVPFPRTGCEQLMTQLLDAVDALVYLILGLVGDGIEEQKVHYV